MPVTCPSQGCVSVTCMLQPLCAACQMLVIYARALEKIPRRSNEFDPSESGGHNLLEEMSLLELRQRLAATKQRHQVTFFLSKHSYWGTNNPSHNGACHSHAIIHSLSVLGCVSPTRGGTLPTWACACGLWVLVACFLCVCVTCPFLCWCHPSASSSAILSLLCVS